MQWLALLLLPLVGWILLLWRSMLVGERPKHVHTLGPTAAKTDLMDHAVELFGEVVNRHQAAVTTSQQATPQPPKASSSSSTVSRRRPTRPMSMR
jgi:hypothetical protein